MGTLRRRIGYGGLLVVVLSAGLLWTAQPAGAAGTPPIIRAFDVSALNQPGFSSPHLRMNVQVDDPDGQVPLTIQSVVVTGPDSRTFDLTNLFRYPNLGSFRGQYFLDAGAPVPLGTYTVTVTDTQGNPVTAADALNAFPSLLPANVTSPQPEQILTTTTPTFQWDPIGNAGSVRVQICNADQGTLTCGETLYTGPLLPPGTATQFTLPSGVIDPGRRYALRIEAFDTPTNLPTANIVSRGFRNFSVAGPNVSLFLNQSTFKTGDTLHLGVNFRNDLAPLHVDVKIWAGLPSREPVKLQDFDDVVIPLTLPDVSTVVNDLFVYTFTGTEPPGNYVLGIRVLHRKTDGTIAQSITAFTFAP